jgi:di/tricarboxylate transporter
MAITMTLQAGLTLIILIAALTALASQHVRPDLVAVCVTVALILSGVLSPSEAFAAFGQPVIILIACVYVLGTALSETGVATVVSDQLLRFGDRGPTVLVLVIVFTAGLLSSVLSSMLIVAALLPAVLRLARRASLAPGQLLLPLSIGATMGNLLTVIGTVSTLVISDLLAAGGFEPLGFFSVTPIGLVSLLLAAAWFALAGRRLLPKKMADREQQPTLDEVEHAYRLEKMLYRLRIRSESDLIARRLEQTPLSTTFHLNLVAVQASDGRLEPARPERVLDHNDILIVEGAKGDLFQAAGQLHLEPKGSMPLEEFNQIEEETLRLAELMVPFRSQWVGQSLAAIDFRDRYGLNILAVHRQGQAIREDLPHLSLAAGDTLLVQGPQSRLRQAGRDTNLVLVTHLGPQPGDLVTSKAKLTFGALVVMVLAVASGLLDLAVASLIAVVFLVFSRAISLRRAYESIDGSVVVLVGGMLPLAMALQKTGVAEWIAGQLAGLQISSLAALLLLYLFTAVLTQLIPNTVAAALVAPIAINLALAQGQRPETFALAMVVAVAASYVTALTNIDVLLVREPGSYSMRHYLANGLSLFILQTIAVLILLLTR